MHTLLTHPPFSTLRYVTAGAFIATVLLFGLFQVHDQPLRPHTIVSLEFAWTPAAMQAMVNDWGAAGNQAATESLWIDFLFMPAYATLFAALTLLEARWSTTPLLRTVGLWLTPLPFVAALLDVVENINLLIAMQTPTQPPAAALTLAGLCASLKFFLLLISLIYIMGAWAKRRFFTKA